MDKYYIQTAPFMIRCLVGIMPVSDILCETTQNTRREGKKVNYSLRADTLTDTGVDLTKLFNSEQQANAFLKTAFNQNMGFTHGKRIQDFEVRIY